MSSNIVYQLKITLKGSKPPIWRRIQLRSDATLAELHVAIQIAMGWWDDHRHGFVIDKRRYSELDPFAPDDGEDEEEVQLDSVLQEKSKFIYVYDFGDNWQHDIVVEKVLTAEDEANYPRCLDGARACPPEDCGGISGYEAKLAILGNRRHPEHEEMFEIFGEDYDPQAFDIEAVNRELAHAWSGTRHAVDELPDYSEEELAELEVDELLGELLDHADRVPRNLIDACAARGDEMIEELQEWFDAPSYGLEESDDDGDWWLAYHAAMIAGLVPTPAAGELLLALMHYLEERADEQMQEWLAGSWPALFANKPLTFAEPLRAIAEERSSDFLVRTDAVEARVSLAAREGAQPLEAALDWLAGLVRDEESEWTARLLFAGNLLNFPRERFRPLLSEMARRQQDIDKHFDMDGLERAMAQDTDHPSWERFDNPWKFYEHEAIAARQQRWAEEAERLLEANRDELDDLDEDVFGLMPSQEPYSRNAPKVGRNDPCPCGSGKKYKKCCLVVH